MSRLEKDKKLEIDYVCWKCREVVLPEKVKKDGSRIYICCPHCDAKFIRGVRGWVRPYFTLTTEEKAS